MLLSHYSLIRRLGVESHCMDRIMIRSLIILILIMTGCSLDDDIFQRSPEGLEGTWKLVESASSIGAELKISKVKNGSEITFLANETFVMKPREECGSGFFYFQDDKLILDLFCGHEEAKTQTIIYEVIFEDNFMKLTPIDPVCIEGCWYKYKKLIE